MAVRPEGTPCWADAMFPDLEAAKRFYGELLGWTYGESAVEYGDYTQAYVDGKAVAAISPQMPGMENVPASWNLYFATPDADATAVKIRENGGTLMTDPMTVGDFGTMVTAQDPGGMYFSAWQAAAHEGFEKTGEPGAYAWVDLLSRDVEKTDAFFPAVFPFRVRRMDVDDIDFRLWSVGDEPVAGRMRMTEGDFPDEVPPFINVYFSVAQVDDALATVGKLGGRTVFGPTDSPFGRFATVLDQQGAVFSVIDLETREGDVPPFI
ncbi:VOC family protein [Streptomyces sp. NPDC004609]|uniref:VOC family protein n=1 Tax=Streptomyces sp. NPDC004609 TaxID=3364704 RepID=UPI00369603E4